MSDVERIRDFLIDELHWPGSRAELTEEFPLIENRVIDSMGLLRLIAWMEPTFGIEVADEEVVPANFGTLAAMQRLVDDKLRSRPVEDRRSPTGG
jgi:acyl carrier protein